MKKFVLVGLLCAPIFYVTCFSQVPTDVVISQIYSGGGNTGAVFLNDYVELFNPTSAAVDVGGWSVQYGSMMGSTWSSTNLTGFIAPFSYYLIQGGSGGTNGMPLPAADVMGAINMSASGGKVMLSGSNVILTGVCPFNSSIVDMIGYGSETDCYEGGGPAGTPSNTMALIRYEDGCLDVNDNLIDYFIGTPTPRNLASPSHSCDPSSVYEYVVGSDEQVEFIEVYNLLGVKVLELHSPIASLSAVNVSQLGTGVFILRLGSGILKFSHSHILILN